MRNAFFCLVFSWFLSLPAPCQTVISLHPIFTESQAVLIPGAEGTWAMNDFGVIINIWRGGDNFYFLQYGEVKNPSTFEAIFIKIGNEILLDLRPLLPDTLADDFFRQIFPESHLIYRVMLKNDSLHLFEINPEWVKKNVLPYDHERRWQYYQKGLLNTYQTPELMAFITCHVNEEGFFRPMASGKKIPISRKETGILKQVKPLPGLSQKGIGCLPSFPLKDGWLGADGAYGVRLSDHRRLFFFSDTWVGKRGQHHRTNDMAMVSNSVAVETCLPDGSVDIFYSWNQMYSTNPKPLFSSQTTRYHYWVCDAFTAKSFLYVVLGKIGSKPDAKPGDLFNFKPMGYSLAVINNPLDSPSLWDIQYRSLPEFINPEFELGPHIIKDSFVYFVVNRNHNAQQLVRTHMELLENETIAWEYFARNKTWKPGLNAGDMDTLFSGFRATTINYHPDLECWLMVQDIEFMEGKVNIRSAPAPEGPWSEAMEVYDCPETKKGSSEFREGNFCYNAREVFDNYLFKTNELYITYDINNSNSDALIADSRIYVPKIIRIPLKNVGCK